jgi:hypothetical protein
VMLIGTPGVSQLANFGTTPVRGLHVFNDYLYVVYSSSL